MMRQNGGWVVWGSLPVISGTLVLGEHQKLNTRRYFSTFFADFLILDRSQVTIKNLIHM